MKNTLATYEYALGQAISLPESKVFYISSVQEPLKDIVTS